MMARVLRYLISVVLLGVSSLGSGAALAQGGSTVYLPWVSRFFNPVAGLRTVNAPYYADVMNGDGTIKRFSEMAIFWFGRVYQAENYADVRVAYSDTELVIYIGAFDRYLWYNTAPSAADLPQWDTATIYLNLTGNVGSAPTANAYRFDAQLNNGGPVPANFKASYRGNGSGWGAAAISFIASAGWRGTALNDSSEDRGWAMTFRIPFASLGVSKPAASAPAWGLAVVLHDRDSAGGPPVADKGWPEAVDTNSPSTWGRLRWAIPTYTPPSSTLGGTVVIQHQYLNNVPNAGLVVTDADLGGTVSNQCPGDSNFIWNQWGNATYPGATGLNVQNQDDISDWPCFAKIYLTFPISPVPTGGVIRSATLTLHQFGGSGDAINGDPATDNLIQVLSVAQDWNESTITWNNAPLAVENFGFTRVTSIIGCGDTLPWPCTPRTWDVSALVAQAYASRTPVRIVLYSASGGYSTGKFFTSSEVGDWNFVGRPKLTVEWGTP